MRLSADNSLALSPSDLTAYLACPHLASLSVEVAFGDRERPHGREALADLVAQKGELHEAQYLASLRELGREVVEIGWPAPAMVERLRDQAGLQLHRYRTGELAAHGRSKVGLVVKGQS